MTTKDKQQPQKASILESKSLNRQPRSAPQSHAALDPLQSLQRNLGNSYLQAIAPKTTNSDLEDSQSNASLESAEVPSIVHEVIRSPGQPLDLTTRAFMESRFNHDFGGVRVHTNAKAVESALAVSAKAYTVKNNVVFGEGNYAPTTQEGKQRLAHELTHVVQQDQNSGELTSLTLAEQEAGQIATQINSAPIDSISHAVSAGTLQREALTQEELDEERLRLEYQLEHAVSPIEEQQVLEKFNAREEELHQKKPSAARDNSKPDTDSNFQGAEGAPQSYPSESEQLAQKPQSAFGELASGVLEAVADGVNVFAILPAVIEAYNQGYASVPASKVGSVTIGLTSTGPDLRVVSGVVSAANVFNPLAQGWQALRGIIDAIDQHDPRAYGRNAANLVLSLGTLARRGGPPRGGRGLGTPVVEAVTPEGFRIPVRASSAAELGVGATETASKGTGPSLAGSAVLSVKKGNESTSDASSQVSESPETEQVEKTDKLTSVEPYAESDGSTKAPKPVEPAKTSEAPKPQDRLSVLEKERIKLEAQLEEIIAKNKIKSETKNPPFVVVRRRQTLEKPNKNPADLVDPGETIKKRLKEIESNIRELQKSIAKEEITRLELEIQRLVQESKEKDSKSQTLRQELDEKFKNFNIRENQAEQKKKEPAKVLGITAQDIEKNLATAQQEYDIAKEIWEEFDNERKELEGKKESIQKELRFAESQAHPEKRAILPCFSADTLVWTSKGTRYINELCIGETVFAFDFVQSMVVEKPILEIFKNKTLHFYAITVGNTVIHATGKHRFWVESQSGWVEANALKSGMQLKSLNGSTAEIYEVKLIENLESDTYNLSISNCQNYFVGSGILVHNQGSVDLGLGDNFIIYRGTYGGSNAEYKDWIYIGQTTEQDIHGKPRGEVERQQEHIKNAKTKLSQHAKGKIQLSQDDIKFYEFMQDVKLTKIVTGIKTKAQADYLEQQNIEIERGISGFENVKNRREQIASDDHMKKVKDTIVKELEAEKIQKYCRKS
ncbi:DUF4157 domain-containing protein [Cyanobacteria bacterium FACHB-472]|nr:DUF4157 domain-containing protein [Cyanobacteria bacterium FACHB-472]